MSKPKNITVEISGMSCASCAQRIESAIGKTEGVNKSIVNFATRKATVTGSVTAEEIHKIIEGLGYNVVKEETPAVSEEEIAQSEWKKFLTSAVLSIPVFIISMFMLHFKFSDLCQFILTTAVIFWPGIGFFKNASELITKVEKGEIIHILRHGKPVAEITPLQSEELPSPSWKKPTLKLSSKGISLSQAIIEERNSGA